MDEGDGFVEICAAILKPANASTLHDTYVASFNLSLADGSAFGKIIHIITLITSFSYICFFLSQLWMIMEICLLVSH